MRLWSCMLRRPTRQALLSPRSPNVLSCEFSWNLGLRSGRRGLRLRRRLGLWSCRGGCRRARRTRRRLGAAADRSVGGELLLNVLLELGRDAVGGAAVAL